MSDQILGSTATTSVLTVNGAAGTSTIDTAGDEDWWRINLTAGLTHVFRLTTTSTNLDPFLGLLNASGTLLTYNDDDGAGYNSMIVYTPSYSGTYYLGATSYDGSTGNYSLRATRTDTIRATTGTTSTLTVNSAAGTSAIDAAGDEDWWKVTLTAGMTYSFQLTATSTGFDTFLGLLNSSGNLIAYNDDFGTSPNSRITFTPTTSGTYYLAAAGFDDSVGNYSIRATRADNIPASTATTATLTVNGTAGASAIDMAGDQDWWKVTLTAGTTYVVRQLGSPSGSAGGLTMADPYLYGIYNNAGLLISGTANDDYGASTESRVVFTPTTTGTYYVSAGAYGNYTGRYQIAVTSQSNADIAATTATTASLAVNGVRTSTISPAGDQDWFRVSLTAGQTYNIDLSADSTSTTPLQDPYFRGIRNSAGVLIPGTTNDDYGSTLNSRVQYTPTTTGIYYLAAGAYGSYTGAYSIRLSARTNSTDTISANTSTTGTIALGSAGVNGVVNFSRDVDWYRVTLTAGQTYVINLRGSDSGQGTLSDPNFVGVYNNAGVLISGTGNDNSSNSSDSQSIFKAPTSGVYYLAATGANDLTGTYRLSIETSTSTDIPDNTTTSATLTAGTPFTSQIDAAGDEDWVKVSLTRGQTYRINLQGAPSNQGTLADPLISGVYTSAGQVISNTFNDDFGSSRESQITFVATATGNYYVGAAGYGSATGTYTLNIAAVGAADTTAPTLLTVSPQDEATAVQIDSNLSLTFNEAVRAGTGNIRIAGGGQTLSIPVTSSQISFSDDVMTINPTANLLANTRYTVTMPTGVVKDQAGNNFAGIANTSRFNFTTAQAGTQTGDEWTIMVYIAADNNLEPFAISDLNEMESVNLPGNVNVVTLVDRIGGYDSSNGNWTGTKQGAVVHDSNTGTVTSFSSFSNLGELNTGNGTTLTNFINWAADGYESEHYALVVWDHGGGLSGVAWDDTSNDHLAPTELVTAINNSTVDRFDLVGFDACLMGMVEQAWDLRGLTDVVVASEELIPGDGWAYDRWLNSLALNPNMTATNLGSAIVSGYGAEYAGQDDITLSAVQTSALGALNTTLNQFVTDALSTSTTAADWTALRTAASRSIVYPADSASYNYRDLGQFMTQVSSTIGNTTLRTDAANVAARLNNAVFAQTGTVAGATGLSIYMPYGSTAVSSTYTAANHSFLAASNWENFLAVL